MLFPESEVKVFQAGAKGLLLKAQVNGCSPRPDWHMIECASLSRIPFDLHLKWCAVSGGMHEVDITVSRGTRLSLYCSMLELYVKNLGTEKNEVMVTLAEGTSSSPQTLERWGDCDGVEKLSFDVPAWCSNHRITLSEQESLLGTVVEYLLPDGRKICVNGTIFLHGSLSIGAAVRVSVLTPTPATVRLSWGLNL
ncbi:MAG: hypothetical protein ACKO6N_21115 [Myxococcota bacterium]